MKVVKLNNNNLKQFIAFCRKYKHVHDASYLYEDEDLKTFKVSDANPTLLLLKNDNIAGALSIMADDSKSSSVRARIFFCEYNKGYKLLINEMKRLCAQIKQHITGLHLFIPDDAPAVKTLMSLGFNITSKSYRLAYNKSGATPSQLTLPNGYSLCPLSAANTNQWKGIYDSAFSYSWENSPISHESLMDDLKSPYVLPKGMMMICKNDVAVGLIVLSKDDNNIAEIETLAVLPNHQGKGIGMMLLRYGINTIINEGYHTPTLSVSSNRPNALHLYTKAGFTLEKTFLVLEQSWQA